MKIAVTGGIGSGKSTVSRILREKGYKVVSADTVYKNLLRSGEFVESVYDALSLSYSYKNGKVFFDKKLVSALVFSDKEKLRLLNEKTHIKVYEKLNKIYAGYEEDKPLFFEIPLLFESGAEKDFDAVWVVVRDKVSRIKSVAKRSGLTEGEVLARMENQIDYDKFPLKAHTLIYNDEDVSSLAIKVNNALKDLGN